MGTRRSDAVVNDERILDAAREVFTHSGFSEATTKYPASATVVAWAKISQV